MHQPVLMEKVLEYLAVRPGSTCIDGTVGSGGHADALARAVGKQGRVLGIDRDSQAVERARRRLAVWGKRVCVMQGNYADMKQLAGGAGIQGADAVLLDLGVSSEQLDTPERGFGFTHEGPLDMRMDTSAPLTAAELVNSLSEQELASLIRNLGEERHARRIARRIAAQRQREPIRTTRELADLVTAAVGGRRGAGRHPATRTFQALRMEVNREKQHLEAGLEAAIGMLVNGGRVGVISFHSLEDRAVKTCFRRHAGAWESLQQGGRAWRGEEPRLRLLTRKPVTADEAEVRRNPRARSAKLRAAERVESTT